MPDDFHLHLSISRLLLGRIFILQPPVSWAPWNDTPDQSWPVDVYSLSQICFLTERTFWFFLLPPCAGAYSCLMWSKPEWTSIILWWSIKKPIVVTQLSNVLQSTLSVIKLTSLSPSVCFFDLISQLFPSSRGEERGVNYWFLKVSAISTKACELIFLMLSSSSLFCTPKPQ